MVWRYLPVNWVEHLVRLLITLGCCFMIGFNREKVHRPAGLRTHILVGLSAALVMLTGDSLLQDNTAMARMGAQVISGIGFLGAGTILTVGVNVKGLTTAASLWAIACIGLAVGSGNYFDGIVATSSIYLVLDKMRNYKALQEERTTRTIIIHVGKENYGELLKRIAGLFSEQKIEIIKIENTHKEGSLDEQIAVLQIRYCKTNRREEAIRSVMLMDHISRAELGDPVDSAL